MQLFDGLSSQFMYNLSGPGDRGASNAAIDQLLLVLNFTQDKAYCVFQDIDNPRVINKLWELHNIGRDVRVGMDEDNRTYMGYKQLNTFLPSIGRNRKLWIGNKGAGEVYLNFCVVDERRAFFSTAPPTEIGLNSSPFMYGMLQSHEDGIVRKLSGATDLILNGSFGASKQRLNQRNHWLIGDTDIGIYMAPEENPVNFMAKRIPGAKSSIQLFSTEFFSNRRVTATQQRTLEDIAFEIDQSGVPVKSVIGSWKNDTELDPNALGNCSFNEYLGLDCNSFANSGTTGTAPRRVNSMHYLREKGIEPRIYADAKPSNSLNMLVLDTGQPTGMAFVASHSLSSRGDSSHDGLMFVFEDRLNVDRVSSFLGSLRSKTLESNSKTGKTDAGFLSVVISELNWMGGGNSVGSDTSSEWIELYNNTDAPINVSDWIFQCGTSGSFATVFRFPQRTIIGSKQYFLVEHDRNTQLREVHLRINFGADNAINDSRTDQCRILDSLGRVIDIAGNQGVPFISRSDTFGKIDVDRRHFRTMERIRTDLPGENISNWKTNTNSDPNRNFNFDPDFYEKTFGTPGYASMTSGNLPPDIDNPARSLVINEVVFATASDTFVEIFNPTDQSIQFNSTNQQISLFRSNNCNISGGSYTQKIDISGSIPPQGYYVLARPGLHDAVANDISLGTLGTGYCLGLILSDNVTGLNHPGLIDFVNLENNAISILGGSFVPTSSSNRRSQRCPNGFKTDVFSNSTDFTEVPAGNITPGGANNCN
ncbi:MAG: lamin tail domain-containing protein [Leptospira sp.]|nr:lamin tail domain-containing protein [Leptospira sp.]